MNRLYLALAAYAGLALLAWQTLEDEKIRLLTLVILGGITVKTLLHRREGVRSSNSSE